MGMTIDNANKLLSVITSTITEDDDCFTIEDENLQVFKETLLTAIDTMRKYQRVQERIKAEMSFDNPNMDVKNLPGLTRVLEIFGEVEDGNDD